MEKEKADLVWTSPTSILLSEGIDIWAIAKNMGHKDIKQITETYGHLIKEKAEVENEKVRQALQKINAA